MIQATFASETGFEKYGRKSKRELFLDTMNAVVPRGELEALIAPYYPRAARGANPWDCRSCGGLTSCSSGSTCRTRGWRRRSMNRPRCDASRGMDLGRAPAPDETTVLRFRHLLEEHDLGPQILATVNLYLEGKGVASRRGRSWTRPFSTHPVRRRIGVHVGGERGRRTSVARLTARRGAQGVGRRGVSGTGRGDSPGRRT
jgi:IS5 family transposase